MPSRAGRSARGLGSGRGGDAGGRGGEGGHRRPSPVLSGVLGGRLRPRRHAELAESPFSSPWGGGLRPGAERRPRGEGARPRGSGGERAAARPDARRSGGPRGTEHGARSLSREGVAAGGRADAGGGGGLWEVGGSAEPARCPQFKLPRRPQRGCPGCTLNSPSGG